MALEKITTTYSNNLVVDETLLNEYKDKINEIITVLPSANVLEEIQTKEWHVGNGVLYDTENNVYLKTTAETYNNEDYPLSRYTPVGVICIAENWVPSAVDTGYNELSTDDKQKFCNARMVGLTYVYGTNDDKIGNPKKGSTRYINAYMPYGHSDTSLRNDDEKQFLQYQGNNNFGIYTNENDDYTNINFPSNVLYTNGKQYADTDQYYMYDEDDITNSNYTASMYNSDLSYNFNHNFDNNISRYFNGYSLIHNLNNNSKYANNDIINNTSVLNDFSENFAYGTYYSFSNNYKDCKLTDNSISDKPFFPMAMMTFLYSPDNTGYYSSMGNWFVGSVAEMMALFNRINDVNKMLRKFAEVAMTSGYGKIYTDIVSEDGYYWTAQPHFSNGWDNGNGLYCWCLYCYYYDDVGVYGSNAHRNHQVRPMAFAPHIS